MKSLGPILTVLMVIFAFWYLMAIKLNSQWEYDQAVRAKVEVGFWDILPGGAWPWFQPFSMVATTPSLGCTVLTVVTAGSGTDMR